MGMASKLPQNKTHSDARDENVDCVSPAGPAVSLDVSLAASLPTYWDRGGGGVVQTPSSEGRHECFFQMGNVCWRGVHLPWTPGGAHSSAAGL